MANATLRYQEEEERRKKEEGRRKKKVNKFIPAPCSRLRNSGNQIGNLLVISRVS